MNTTISNQHQSDYVLAELDTMLSVGSRSTPRRRPTQPQSGAANNNRAFMGSRPRGPIIPDSLFAEFKQPTTNRINTNGNNNNNSNNMRRSTTADSSHQQQVVDAAAAPPPVPYRRHTALQNRKLPREVLLRVLHFLDPVSLTRLSSTNKRFLDMCRGNGSQALWAALRVAVCFRGNERTARTFDEQNPSAPSQHKHRLEVVGFLVRDRQDVMHELVSSESALRDVEERVRIRQRQLADRWQTTTTTTPHLPPVPASHSPQQPNNNTFRSITQRHQPPQQTALEEPTTSSTNPFQVQLNKLGNDIALLRQREDDEAKGLVETNKQLTALIQQHAAQIKLQSDKNMFQDFERKVCRHVLACADYLPLSVRIDTVSFSQLDLLLLTLESSSDQNVILGLGVMRRMWLSIQRKFPINEQYFELKQKSDLQKLNPTQTSLKALVRRCCEVGISAII